jgi:hypothetical protein
MLHAAQGDSHARSQQYPSAQIVLLQSPGLLQGVPPLHFSAQGPPQSTPASPLFWTPSKQPTHLPDEQMLFAQSPLPLHFFPSRHVLPHEPPQSASLSSPFFLPSEQLTHSVS